MAPQLAWIGLGNMGRVSNAGKKSYQMADTSDVNATPQNTYERVGLSELFGYSFELSPQQQTPQC